MTTRANSRVAWFNGEFMPESRLLIRFRDRSSDIADHAQPARQNAQLPEHDRR
jgi:hypothetical protein